VEQLAGRLALSGLQPDEVSAFAVDEEVSTQSKRPGPLLHGLDSRCSQP
jgi:hypothetical protein